MKLSKLGDCPECGPYVRTQPPQSLTLRLMASFLGCWCHRCMECGTFFLVPAPSAGVWGHIIRLPLRVLRLL